MEQRLLAKPREQFVAIGRVQYVVERVLGFAGRALSGGREQMQVVIAENHDSSVAERFDSAEHSERSRAPIDEIAHEPESIARWIETERVDDPRELLIATLNVANRVSRHRQRTLAGNVRASQSRT